MYNVKGQDTIVDPPILSRYMFNILFNVTCDKTNKL